MLAFMIGGVRPLSADDRDDTELPVTIQIHDYSHVSSGSLTRARAVVTAMYERIGVRTEWMGVVQQRLGQQGPSRRDEISRIPIAQVTLIILTAKMAARGHVSEGALGFAAVPEEGMGRNRVCDLRPRQRHGSTGGNERGRPSRIRDGARDRTSDAPSRCTHGRRLDAWSLDVRDFQRIDVLKLGFPQRKPTRSAARFCTTAGRWP
jgi:hypothetical protein